MNAQSKSDKEFSVRSIILGLILALVMGAANIYLGLKIGMTITASIPAAVIAIMVLRGIFKNGTIFESNLVQTAASSGSDIGTGIIFTLPAFVFIGFWDHFDYKMTTLIALAGGIFGILLMIPMRKVFIVGKYRNLPYPEAHATVSVMKTAYRGDTAKKEGMSLLYGGFYAFLMQVMVGFLGIFKSPLEYAGQIAGRIFYVGGDLSPALIGIGFIVRLPIAICVFIGAFIAWAILLPMMSAGVLVDNNALEMGWGIWSSKIRFVGVGAMLVGGLVSIFNAREGLSHALKEIFGKRSTTKALDHERDIAPEAILFCAIISVLCLSYVFYEVTGSITITIVAALAMVVLAFFFTSVANYIVAIVGSSNSPVSGMNISAVVIVGLLLVVLGYTGMSGMVATLGVAAVICCVTCMAGDSCNELKMGHMIGASPFRQQIMLILGMTVSAFLIAPILQLLHENSLGGIGGRELSAPQAALMASLVEGIFGKGKALPWDLVILGAGIGLTIVLLDIVLSLKQSQYRLPIMPVAVGLYLPATISLPMLIGALIAWFIAHDKDEKINEKRLQTGVLFASGFVAGESLTGVFIALLASLGVSRLDFGLPSLVQQIISCFGALALVAIFYRGTRVVKNYDHKN